MVNNKLTPDVMKTTCGCYLLYEGNIFLCHATGHPFDIWGIPKGVCEINETPEDAMFRELYEETNIVLADYSYKWLDLGCIPYEKKPKILHGYVVVLSYWDYHDVYCSSTYIDRNGIIRPEIDGFEWVPIEDGLTKISSIQRQLWHKNDSNIKRIIG